MWSSRLAGSGEQAARKLEEVSPRLDRRLHSSTEKQRGVLPALHQACTHRTEYHTHHAQVPSQRVLPFAGGLVLILRSGRSVPCLMTPEVVENHPTRAHADKGSQEQEDPWVESRYASASARIDYSYLVPRVEVCRVVRKSQVLDLQPLEPQGGRMVHRYQRTRSNDEAMMARAIQTLQQLNMGLAERPLRIGDRVTRKTHGAWVGLISRTELGGGGGGGGGGGDSPVVVSRGRLAKRAKLAWPEIEDLQNPILPKTPATTSSAHIIQSKSLGSIGISPNARSVLSGAKRRDAARPTSMKDRGTHGRMA